MPHSLHLYPSLHVPTTWNCILDVFDDGRLMIVVTQYDKFYEGDADSEMSVETVQQRVVEMIEKALDLKLSKPLRRDLVIPVSGLWAYWVRTDHR